MVKKLAHMHNNKCSLMNKSVNLTEKKLHWCNYFQVDFKYWKYFKTHSLNIILTVSIYDYQAIGSNSVMYIFHKGILS